MRNLFLLILFAAFSKINAQGTLANSLLWKISNNNTDQDSYIFLSGPVCDDDIKMFPQLEDVLKKVNSIAIEYTLYESKDAPKFQAAAKALNGDQNLRANLSLAEYASFKNALINVGMPEAMIDQFNNNKISMAYYLLMVGNSPCGAGAQPGSYETILQKYASKNKLYFGALQTVDELLTENNSHTTDYWKQNIRFLLQNESIINPLLQTEMNLYKAEDLNSFQQLGGNKFYQLKYSDTILNGHVNFISNTMEPLLQKGKALIVIDWANLVFAKPSLLDLLKKKYSVTPVTN